VNNTNLISTETIIAHCTPRGQGALALLRISGQQALVVVDSFAQLATAKKLVSVSTHTIHYGTVIDTNKQVLDKVLFFVMHAPHTFTGEHTIEITCHNNPFIIASIIEQAITQGARLAYPGEFTRRAVLHDKIDLMQAEAIDELIHANTQLTLKKALAQLEGSLSHWVTTIEQELITCLAFSDSSFEFIEEENMEFGTQIKERLQKTLHTLTQLKKNFDQQQQIRQGIRIALLGTVNAGKSSLFNALIGKDRSIVTNIPGTTRDVIEAGLYKYGNYWTLIDTAGLRKTDDKIEQEGIKRSFKEAQNADIILLLCDRSQEWSVQETTVYHELLDAYGKKIILITSKDDLPQQAQHAISWKEILPFSVKKPEQLSCIEQNIQHKIEKLFEQAESPFLLTQRQYTLLLALEKNLVHIVSMLTTHPISYELVSFHLNDSLKYFAELTGKSVSEAAIDAVFRNFCVGK
jgi:tRNA modification GTPase